MARLTFDGNWRVFIVDSISDISAPTVAEIDAGTEITSFIPKNGLSITNNSQMVDTADLSSQFDSQVMGTYGMSVNLTVKLDDATDTAADEFVTHGAQSHLVVLPYKGTGAVASSDEAHVLPIESGRATPNGTEPNAEQTANVPIAVTGEPELFVTVSA